ncbi:MAG: hypothetical protein EA401_06480 [Planctomycetota bacterium]|nr:MAG: hypothetical protein EA401_06480 [Planctomycetota bacterium]
MGTTDVLILFLVAMFAIIIVLALLLWSVLMVWWQAALSRAPVPLGQLFRLRLRRMPLAKLIACRIQAARAGIHLDIQDLAAHHQRGGRVEEVTHALTSAKKEDLPLSWEHACTADLKHLNQDADR